MQQNKFIFILICTIFVISSCIENYTPQIENQNSNKLVIFGTIADEDSIQTINITRSSDVSKPEEINVSGCIVFITDDKGNNYFFPESKPGKYSLKMPKEKLTPGVSYQLTIQTTDGQTLQSELETMNECPDIGNIYGKPEELATNDPKKSIPGTQFYIDFDKKNSKTNYYKFELFETYEYHADYSKFYYYNGRVNQLPDYDSTTKICWNTMAVSQFFTLSTEDLNQNQYNALPLHFVNNKTTKLKYGYSLLVKQQAISEKAFTYWDNLRKNSERQGGMYETQPIQVVGNIHNQTNPNEEVYGFFQVVSQKSKRIFVDGRKDIAYDFYNYCSGGFPPPKGLGWRAFDPAMYPIYFKYDDHNNILIFEKGCVDCREQFGDIVKPIFWPK